MKRESKAISVWHKNQKKNKKPGQWQNPFTGAKLERDRHDWDWDRKGSNINDTEYILDGKRYEILSSDPNLLISFEQSFATPYSLQVSNC